MHLLASPAGLPGSSSRFSSRFSPRSNLSLRQTGSKAGGLLTKASRSVTVSAILAISAVVMLALFLTSSPLLAQTSLSAASLKGALAPCDLRVEYLANPLGVDTPQPRFFWKTGTASAANLKPPLS